MSGIIIYCSHSISSVILLISERFINYSIETVENKMVIEYANQKIALSFITKDISPEKFYNAIRSIDDFCRRIKTKNKEIPISVYSNAHTGPKTQFGGLNIGFSRY